MRIHYVCDLCGQEYDELSDCMLCEDNHVRPTPFGLDCTGYIRIKAEMYPSIINVPMNNGRVVQYEYAQLLPAATQIKGEEKL